MTQIPNQICSPTMVISKHPNEFESWRYAIGIKAGKKREISQREASEILGVSLKTWQIWENEGKNPIHVLFALSALYSGLPRWPGALGSEMEMDSLRASMESLGVLKEEVTNHVRIPKR